MKGSEKNAAGGAMWDYRYSVALMYCGRLEEALNYAEKGIQEEPDYPWIWLQAGKLDVYKRQSQAIADTGHESMASCTAPSFVNFAFD